MPLGLSLAIKTHMIVPKAQQWVKSASKPLIAQVYLVEVYRADTHFIDGLYDVHIFNCTLFYQWPINIFAYNGFI